jgi:hypothetical protein
VSESGDYGRGRVDATLDDHSAHLRKINGSIDRFADVVEKLTLAVQRLGDAADADRQTVKVTAEALEKQDQTRRDKGDAHWTPFQRGIAAITGAAALAGIVYEVLHH